MRTESVETAPHAQWGVAVLVALDGVVRVEGREGTAEGPVVVVPADLEHVSSARGPVVSVLLDADLHRDAAVTVRRVKPFRVAEPSLVTAAQSTAKGSVLSLPGAASVMASRILPLGNGTTHAVRDARLAALVRAPEKAETVSLRSLASRLDLSPGHASTLFHAHVGISFRRWQLWRRLMRAIPYLRPGGLAHAAQEAGFADQAHLSRTCARLLGYTPRTLAALGSIVRAR
ncbi:Transcriptional regulator, AraC family [Labilithrix luteola]|uniref:Transcriptional regulator, AraC family n=2 Tax=Labilithrix luteola TaxID=1391654 RepID=A0A0K1QDX2_9BACT|nr:Transcriptional regulator, AraC family [Labilithrix luteola]